MLKKTACILVLSVFFCPSVWAKSAEPSSALITRKAWGKPPAKAKPVPKSADKDEFEEILDRIFSDDPVFRSHIFTSVGNLNLDISPINQQMETQGYGPFQSSPVAFGGGMQFIFFNLLTEFEGQMALISPVNNQDYWSFMTAGTSFFNLGYQFRPLKNLSIYPLLGVGMNFVDLTFNRRNLQPSFAEFLESPGRQSNISNVNFAFNLGLGVDYSWGWFGLVGLRGGYIWSPVPSQFWALSHLNADADSNTQLPVTNGPAMQMNGPYIRVFAGF